MEQDVHSIIVAAEQGNQAEVHRRIAAQPRLIHATGGWGWTILFGAACSGDVHLVRALLDRGADIDHACYDNTTAIFYAYSVGGGGPVMNLLIDRGADVNVRSYGVDGGMSLLDYAVLDGDVDVIRQLLVHPKIRTQGPWAFMSVCRACAVGRGGPEVLRLLLHAGFDPRGEQAVRRRVKQLGWPDLRPECVEILQDWERAWTVQRTRNVRDCSMTLSDMRASADVMTELTPVCPPCAEAPAKRAQVSLQCLSARVYRDHTPVHVEVKEVRGCDGNSLRSLDANVRTAQCVKRKRGEEQEMASKRMRENKGEVGVRVLRQMLCELQKELFVEVVQALGDGGEDIVDCAAESEGA